MPQTAMAKSGASSVASSKQRDYDYLFKLVLIGDSGVGKSCLLLRFAVSRKRSMERGNVRFDTFPMTPHENDLIVE